MLAVAFSPDGRWLASSGEDKTVRLWDTTSGQARVLEGHASAAHILAFSPDSRQLASAGREPEIRLWNVASVSESRSAATEIASSA